MADEPRRPRSVEFLPPASGANSQPPTPRRESPTQLWQSDNWLPSSLMRRVLHKVVTKEAQAYGERIAAENNIIALWTERLRIQEQFELQAARFGALPLLKSVAEAKVYAEIEQVFEEIDDQKEERLLQRLNRKASIIEAQRRLDELQRPPAPDLPPPAKESRANQKAAAIKRIREECDQLIAVLLAGRREEELDEDDRQLVDECRLNAMRRIKDLLQEG